MIVVYTYSHKIICKLKVYLFVVKVVFYLFGSLCFFQALLFFKFFELL